MDKEARLHGTTAAEHPQTMALEHENWIVKAFDGLNHKDINALHGLLGRAKQGLSEANPQASPQAKPQGDLQSTNP